MVDAVDKSSLYNANASDLNSITYIFNACRIVNSHKVLCKNSKELNITRNTRIKSLNLLMRKAVILHDKLD